MMVVPVLAGAFGLFAFVCWVSAFVHWIMLLGHRKPEVSMTSLFFNGIKAFDPDNFLPSGRAVQKRMLWSMLGFAACVVLGMGVGAIAASAK